VALPEVQPRGVAVQGCVVRLPWQGGELIILEVDDDAADVAEAVRDENADQDDHAAGTTEVGLDRSSHSHSSYEEGSYVQVVPIAALRVVVVVPYDSAEDLFQGERAAVGKEAYVQAFDA
jgi:hypothetical protein